MAVNGLRVGVCGYNALTIGEKSCGQFFGISVCFFGRFIILSVAGQLEVIKFPFVILLALVKEPHCLGELLGIVLVLKEIADRYKCRLFGIGYILHNRHRCAFA